jgi:hypothetical protein
MFISLVRPVSFRAQNAPGAGNRCVPSTSRLARPCLRLSGEGLGSGAARQAFSGLSRALAGLLASVWLLADPTVTQRSLAFAANPYDLGTDRGVQAVMVCRELLEPIPRYVESGSWDKARSNVNYCTRTLRLHTALRAVTDRLLTPEYDLEKHESAMRVSSDLPNVMTQLDATLYTPIFMASDQGVSPAQRKYGDEALGYLEQAKQMLDHYLSLLPSEVTARNAAAAAQMRVPLERQ